MEIRPPGLVHSRTKHPVLLAPYGGPNSQSVSLIQNVNWLRYLAAELGILVVVADGRGTGLRGREWRAPVRGQLGKLEAQDQIAIAEHYASLPFIDEEKLGVFGWSFGGFLAAKILEANSTVRLGISVAPVTDWRLYDSIYAERYMGAPGPSYDESAVTKMDGFKDADFMLAAGSGDDNVHFANSAGLLDRLTFAGIDNFRFNLFVDSRHDMTVRGAQLQLYRNMVAFLTDKWLRKH